MKTKRVLRRAPRAPAPFTHICLYMRRDDPRLVSHAVMTESPAQAEQWRQQAKNLGLAMLTIPIPLVLAAEDLLEACTELYSCRDIIGVSPKELSKPLTLVRNAIRKASGLDPRGR